MTQLAYIVGQPLDGVDTSGMVPIHFMAAMPIQKVSESYAQQILEPIPRDATRMLLDLEGDWYSRMQRGFGAEFQYGVNKTIELIRIINRLRPGLLIDSYNTTDWGQGRDWWRMARARIAAFREAIDGGKDYKAGFASIGPCLYPIHPSFIDEEMITESLKAYRDAASLCWPVPQVAAYVSSIFYGDMKRYMSVCAEHADLIVMWFEERWRGLANDEGFQLQTRLIAAAREAA